MPWGFVAAAGANLLGGIMGADASRSAANTSADAQVKAAQIAADASKFRPVGVTTNFGNSNFGYDSNGNLTSAGYTLNPQLQQLQNGLMGNYGQYLSQAQGLNTSGLTQGGNSLIGLGNSYLATSPQDAASQWMAQQQKLLAPSDEQKLATLNNQMFATGRQGLATGGTTAGGLSQANPEMAAYYNSLANRDNSLASQATQQGMNQATFGAGLLSSGNNLLGAVPALQNAYYSPLATTLNMSQGIESQGQGAMDIGSALGARVTTANTNGANALLGASTNAAKTLQAVNGVSPFGAALSGFGNNSTATNALGNWFDNYLNGGAGTTPSAQLTNYVQNFGATGSGDVMPGTNYSFQ